MTDKYKVSEKKAFKVKVKEGSNNQEVEYEITVEECAMDYTGDYKTDTVVTIDGKKKKVGDTTGTPAACKLKGKVKRGFMSDSVELEELDNVKIESGEKDVSIKELQKNIEVLLEEKKDMEVIEVDAEKFPRLAQNPEFNVLSVPTIFLFRKGQEKWVGKKSGSLNGAAFRLLRGVVQLVEHRPSVPIVVGSSPAASAKLPRRRCWLGAWGLSPHPLWFASSNLALGTTLEWEKNNLSNFEFCSIPTVSTIKVLWYSDFGKATRPGSSNQVEIKFLIDKVVRQRIELFSNGKPVTRYADLDLIDKAKREICIDLLKERYKSVLEHDYDCRDKDIAYNFTIIGKDKINITVRKKGEINSDKITYENEMIKEIEPIFYLTTAVRLDDTSEYQKDIFEKRFDVELEAKVAKKKKKARDSGNYLEYLGFHNPHSGETNLKKESIKKWLEKGAQPADSKLLKSLLEKYL
ncbi:15694_t:CDS:2 [Funneliformis geosporum]|uniref:15694_t:CDS:1 n=1 Tax=Funneliformis geosporum TaxID=1117311 RepID=A0A9W4T0K7_9GLOM|nr:15694_t:CDS:2 [Funneliformis geosporum]